MTQPYQPRPQQPYALQPPLQGQPRKAGFLDIRFTRFLSLNLISIWWVVALIVIAVGMVVGLVAGFMQVSESPGMGLAYIAGSLAGGVVLAVLTRLFLESVAVLFRIADNTSRLGSDRRY